MSAGAAAVGALLVAPVACWVVETIGYQRGRYMRNFWTLPLDAKLDHIARYRSAWWLMLMSWFPSVVAVTAGLAGLAFLLDDPIGWAAFGGFVLAAAGWLVGLGQQCGALSVAAEQRARTGETPSWAAAVPQIGQIFETGWIVFANLAAAGFGVAVLRTDLLASWLGWTAIGIGLAIPVVALLTRQIFPHQALPMPIVLGVALLAT